MKKETQSLLEQADILLDAALSILTLLDKLGEPLEHYNISLNQAIAAILDVLGGIFAQLSLRSEGGVTVDLFYAKCEPFSVVYLKEYFETCQALVKHHRHNARTRLPYDAMAVRAQTLRSLLIDLSSCSPPKELKGHGEPDV